LTSGNQPRIVLPLPGGTTKSLKSLTIQGVAWTLAGDGGNQILRLVSNLVLTRLLVPEMFGLMVMVNVVQQGLIMFSDVGIHPAIVQHARGDETVFLNTAWTTQVIRGFMLWLSTCALAWPVAQFCREHAVLYLLPVVGLGSIVDGFLSTKVITCDRHLSLGRLTILNLGTGLSGLAVRILWAWQSPTVWALIIGGFASNVPRMILSHFIIPGPVNRFCWDRESLRELVKFGRWVFLSTLLTFLSLRLHEIVFIRMIPQAMLGIYSQGSNFCRVPIETVQKIAGAVAFPALCRVRERQGNLESAFVRLRAPLLVCGGAVLSSLTLAAPTLVQILYPVKYWEAGWIMQLISVSLWFQVIQSTNQTAILSLGYSKVLALGNLVKIVAIAAALPIGFSWWGFPGALIAMAVVEIPKYLFEALQVRRQGLRGWRVELGLTVVVLLCAGAALGLHFWGAHGTASWTKLGLAALLWTVLWVPLALWARKVTTMVPPSAPTT
jgi:O-antigen/teichoic acid export membrane protein